MKKIATSLLLLTIGFFSLTSAIPGKPVVAQISNDMVITLPTDQAVAEKYVVDISALNIKSAETLENFCTNFSEQNVTLNADFNSKQIGIVIEPFTDSAGVTWDAAKWNTYFASRAPKMAMYISTFNK